MKREDPPPRPKRKKEQVEGKEKSNVGIYQGCLDREKRREKMLTWNGGLAMRDSEEESEKNFQRDSLTNFWVCVS